jgi:hypothetical protein
MAHSPRFYSTSVDVRICVSEAWSVGPAFAHGCHDLGELGVKSVKLLSFGSARDEGVSIAGYAPAISAQWRASR